MTPAQTRSDDAPVAATEAQDPATGFRGLMASPPGRDLAVAAITTVVGFVLVGVVPPDAVLAGPEALGAVLGFGFVLVRRHRTSVVLAIALVATATALVTWGRPTPMVFAALVVLFTYCVDHDRRRAILVGAGAALAMYVPAAMAINGEAGDERVFIVVVWTIAAVGIADAVRSRRELLASTEARVAAVVEANERARRQELVEQRLDIARDLHDLLAHNLSVMNVQTGVASHLLRADPDAAERALGIARDAGRSILDELRDLLGVLRSDDSGEPTEALPTFDDTAVLVESLRNRGLRLEWRARGTRRPMTPAASLAAYRVIQEAATNAAKHGDGSATLTTAFADAGLEITVSNPVGRVDAPAGRGGPGDAGVGSGLGLVGMRERLAGVGGRLDLDRSDPAWFVLTAVVPVDDRREGCAP